MARRPADLAASSPHSARGEPASPDAAAASFLGQNAGESPLAALERALDQRASRLGRHRYLLVLRFALLNLIGFALLGAAYGEGWVDDVLAADTSYLCVVIFGLFLVGLGYAGHRIWRLSRELNLIRAFDPLLPSQVGHYVAAVRERGSGSRALSAEAMKLKFADRIANVRHIGNMLVLIGLIGTVVGFVVALGGVQPDTAGDIKTVGPMVSTLIEGMSVALYTTLVGAVLNLWLMLNYRMLVSGTVRVVSAIVELGERHARD
jgi:LytS/YehU family sensor histidine kinase